MVFNWVFKGLKSHAPTFLNCAVKHGDPNHWWEHRSHDWSDAHDPPQRWPQAWITLLTRVSQVQDGHLITTLICAPYVWLFSTLSERKLKISKLLLEFVACHVTTVRKIPALITIDHRSHNMCYNAPFVSPSMVGWILACISYYCSINYSTPQL